MPTQSAPTLIACLRQHAEQSPDQCAVAHPAIVLSYAQLWNAVTAQAQAFNALAIDDSATVGICCDDDVQHLVATLACAALGATSCTLPIHQSAAQHQTQSQHCGVTHVVWARHILAHDDLRSAACNAAAEPAPKSSARLLFSTSGTTGQPKIVILQCSDLVLQAPRHVQATSERFACRASMQHNFAKRHRLYCVVQGATNVFIDGPSDTVVDQCLQQHVTVLHLSAFQARELLAAPGVDLLHRVRLKLGGAHVTQALRRQLQETITPDAHFGYGTTETGAIAFSNPADTNAGESVGQALPGIEVSIRDQTGSVQAADSTGEIHIRCGGMFRGYLGDDQRTAATLDTGWFRTGDMGRLDAQGRIHVAGRSDDMFVFNTMNIHPQDIESELLKYPGIRDAVVVPKPSPVHGSIPVALIVCDPDVAIDQRALQQHMREQVGLRCPRLVLEAEHIPRNPAGKILRGKALALLATLEEAR